MPDNLEKNDSNLLVFYRNMYLYFSNQQQQISNGIFNQVFYFKWFWFAMCASSIEIFNEPG